MEESPHRVRSIRVSAAGWGHVRDRAGVDSGGAGPDGQEEHLSVEPGKRGKNSAEDSCMRHEFRFSKKPESGFFMSIIYVIEYIMCIVDFSYSRYL